MSFRQGLSILFLCFLLKSFYLCESLKKAKIIMKKKMNKIDISDEVIDGIYANLAIVTHSPSDFVIDFALAVPGRENPKVKSRIILSPEHAKRILFALQDNIKSYENQFGKIETLNEKRDLEKIISPFSGGEA